MAPWGKKPLSSAGLPVPFPKPVFRRMQVVESNQEDSADDNEDNFDNFPCGVPKDDGRT